MKHRFALPIAMAVTMGAGSTFASSAPQALPVPPPIATPTETIPHQVLFHQERTPITAPPPPQPPTKKKPAAPQPLPATFDLEAATDQILTTDYQWGKATANKTALLQDHLQIIVDGRYGPQTRAAHITALNARGLSTHNVPLPPQNHTRRFPDTSRCESVETLAASIGWPDSEIRTLSYVAYRESRCIPTAYNGTGRDRSYGLVQINLKGSLWKHRSDLCGLTAHEDLFHPETNLRCAHKLWELSGWAPWNM
jgi:hypothetical protein